MKKLLLTLSLAILIIGVAKAQDFKTGIGLRGGYYNGITLKHFIGSRTAMEGLLYTRWGGFELTGLYEIHKPALDINRLEWYYGLGAHIGFFDGSRTGWGSGNYNVVGIDVIGGIEYNFKELPFNLSLDWKPAFDFVGYSHLFYDGAAFSIRYIF
jgi:hypothetical protein